MSTARDHSAPAMTHYCREAWRTALSFEWLTFFEIARCKPRQRGQGPERARKSIPGKAPCWRFRFIDQLRHAPTTDGNERVKRSRITEFLICPTKDPRS